jgi:hypothetical protein
MEADDLDSLIADSLGGVQSALEGERKSAAAVEQSTNQCSGVASEAVRELQQEPPSSVSEGEGLPPTDEFFGSLARTFQDAAFQNAMADVLQKTDVSAATGCIPVDSKSADKSASSAMTADDAGVEDFLQKFLGGFDKAVGSDGHFEQNMASMMASMLSSDLICEPMQQISENLEKWLQSNTGLSAVDQGRYDSQLRLYKQVLSICKSNPDPLPDAARGEVQRLLEELHKLGQLPDEVMNEITPKDAGQGGESFEDFIQSMGLNSNLGAAEQDLLKKLTENPDELTKVMKDMAEGMPEELSKVMKEGLDDEGADACKQQ